MSLISSNTLLSAASALSSRFSSIFGITFSPGVYFCRSSCLSCSVLPLPGLAWRYMSSRVVTVAFGLVSRTEARHDGQV